MVTGGTGASGKDVTMKRSTCRAVLALLLVVPLALPATALAGESNGPPGGWDPPPLGEAVSMVLQALLAPLAGLWEDGRLDIDPNGASAPASAAQAGDPGPVEDGRIGIDPNG